MAALWPVAGLAAGSSPLRGTYGLGCTDPALCTSEAVGGTEGRTVSNPTPASTSLPTTAAPYPGNCESLVAAGLDEADCRVSTDEPGDADAASLSVSDPLSSVTVNWSLGLRGSYENQDGREDWRTGIVPGLDFNQVWPGGSTVLSGSSFLYYDFDGSLGVGDSTASLAIAQDLSQSSSVAANADLTWSREEESAAVPTPADSLDGSLSAGLSQHFGRLTLSGSGRLTRYWVSDGTASDGTTVANGYRSDFGLGGTMRGGFALTPILTGFVQADADHYWFDDVDPSTGTRRDGWRLAGRTGVEGNWPLGLKASAYVGGAVRTYEGAGFADARGLIYGASLDYASPSGLELTASFDSGLSGAGSVAGADAEIDQSLSLAARLAVNPWVTARASASAGWTRYEGSSETGNSYGAGLGLDWAFGRNLSLGADYAYAYDWQSGTGDSQSHTVTTTLTVSR